MGRIWISEKQRIELFLDGAKKAGASYIEDGYAIFICPYKVSGQRAMAIKVSGDGARTDIGTINPSCNNFENDDWYLNGKERAWLLATLQKVKDW